MSNLFCVDQIKSATSLTELTEIIGAYPTVIASLEPAILKKLEEIPIEYDHDFVQAVSNAYWYKHPNIYTRDIHGSDVNGDPIGHLYTVLHLYCSKLTSIQSLDVYDYMDLLCLLCIDPSRINDVQVGSSTYEKFYRYLMGKYFSSDDEDTIITNAMIVNLYPTAMDIPSSNESDMRALTRFIVNLKSSEPNRIQELYEILRYYHKVGAYDKNMESLINRYDKFIPAVEEYIGEAIYAYTMNDPYQYQFADQTAKTYKAMEDAGIDKTVARALLKDISIEIAPYGVQPGKYVGFMEALNYLELHEYAPASLEALAKKYENAEKRNEAMFPAQEAAKDVAQRAARATKYNIHTAYKNYQENLHQVDNQLTKMVEVAKKMFIGDVRTEIVEGKKFTVLGMLKKSLRTAACFSFGKIGGLLAILVRMVLRKKTRKSERRKIIMEIETELELIDEKIDDAKGDGNREAKYALMRTRAELKKALDKIKFGVEADERSVQTARNVVNSNR